jgi:hypothetical protein
MLCQALTPVPCIAKISRSQEPFLKRNGYTIPARHESITKGKKRATQMTLMNAAVYITQTIMNE